MSTFKSECCKGCFKGNFHKSFHLHLSSSWLTECVSNSSDSCFVHSVFILLRPVTRTQRNRTSVALASETQTAYQTTTENALKNQTDLQGLISLLTPSTLSQCPASAELTKRSSACPMKGLHRCEAHLEHTGKTMVKADELKLKLEMIPEVRGHFCHFLFYLRGWAL